MTPTFKRTGWVLELLEFCQTQFTPGVKAYRIVLGIYRISQNELLTYLWYLNLGYTFRGLEVIQKFNNDDNDD